MPENLTPEEIETLVSQIHQHQRDQAQADKDAEADPLVEAASLAIGAQRAQLTAAETKLQAARAKYDERKAFASDAEEELRARLTKAWPQGEKTVGYASMVTRRNAIVRADVTSTDAFRVLDRVLGPTGALGKVVTGLKIDAKTALPLVDALPALREALDITESRSLTIRQPKEA